MTVGVAVVIAPSFMSSLLYESLVPGEDAFAARGFPKRCDAAVTSESEVPKRRDAKGISDSGVLQLWQDVESSVLM